MRQVTKRGAKHCWGGGIMWVKREVLFKQRPQERAGEDRLEVSGHRKQYEQRPWSRKSESHSIVSYSLWPHGLYSPWNPPGQNTGVSGPFLLQGIFPTQGSNPGLPHRRRFPTSWTTREAQSRKGHVWLRVKRDSSEDLRLKRKTEFRPIRALSRY